MADKPPTMPPVMPNAGTEAILRRKLQRLIRDMAAAVHYHIRRSYRANEPVIAQDEMPNRELRQAVKKLARRWQKKFDKAAPELADYFTQEANKRSARQLKRILKEGGFTVEFKMTRAARDVLGASVAESVGLIKSIPAKYFTDIEGAVMRSVSAGRDLATLTKDLQKNYGVSYRRAAFIARDQNNKATAAITRVRQQEIGVTEAIWVHSGGGKEPRPTHVAASKRGQKYDVRKGWWDPAVEKFIFPGELPNCRCVSRPIIPGF